METIEQRVEKFKKLNSYRENNELWDKAGFLVILCANNEAECLPSSVATIERSMRGLDWGLIFGDDGSTDGTAEVMESFSDSSSADFFRIEKLEKQPNVSMAKNALAKISKTYCHRYPGILFCDADDFVERDKVHGLYQVAENTNSNVTVGSWIYFNQKLNKRELKSSTESIDRLTFGPWNTLIHSSLIPDDGLFWNENLQAHGDLLMWWELAAAGVKFTPSSVVTTQYNSNFGTTSRETRVDIKKDRWDKFLEERDKVIKYAGLEPPEV